VDDNGMNVSVDDFQKWWWCMWELFCRGGPCSIYKITWKSKKWQLFMTFLRKNISNRLAFHQINEIELVMKGFKKCFWFTV